MELLFIISVIILVISCYLDAVNSIEKQQFKKIILQFLVFIFSALVICMGTWGIRGAFTKTTKCKEYQVDKIENITVVNSDTTKTIHYIIHDIKR